MKKMNKKGAEMTVGTLVVIILVLVVLVVVLFGFSTGWSSLWGKITNIFFPTKENVQDVIDGCKVACSSGAQYDYCNKARTLRFEASDINTKKVIVSVTVNCSSLQSGGEIGVNSPTFESSLGPQKVALPTTGLSCSDIQC
jgi:hypothetical protein